MKLIKEYTSSLKSLYAEELVDVGFFRPLAFIIVKALYSLPLTPNHYSFFALISGLAAGACFIKGDAFNIKLGAMLFLLSSVLDCCDGMVARMKKNGSPYGKLIDGVVDYLVNITVFVSLAYTFSKSTTLHYGAYFAIPLIPLAGLSKIFHALTYDFYLTQYLNCESGDFKSSQDELLRIQRSLNHCENGIKAWALKAYYFYLKLQTKISSDFVVENPETYCQLNIKNLRLWSFIGPSMHNFLLLSALWLNNIQGYLFYAIVMGNCWALWMFHQQLKNKKLLHLYLNK